MKNIILLVLIASCTQKYSDYALIRKVDYNRQNFDRPITNFQVLAQGKDELGQCFNQWLFFSNAEKQKEDYVPTLVRVLCPGKDFLVDATFTERWWTTILFTQACINIKTTCGNLKKELNQK